MSHNPNMFLENGNQIANVQILYDAISTLSILYAVFKRNATGSLVPNVFFIMNNQLPTTEYGIKLLSTVFNICRIFAFCGFQYIPYVAPSVITLYAATAYLCVAFSDGSRDLHHNAITVVVASSFRVNSALRFL